MNHSIKRSVALALAGAIAVASLTPAAAAPVMSSTAMLQQSAPAQVIDVRWRGRHYHRGGYWGGAAAAGLAAGLLAGAAVAGPRYYYDDGPYYYGPPPPVYYEEPPVYVAPAPVYRGAVDPNGAARKCWVATDRDRGYGYWRAC